MLELAKEIENLEVFTHVSTAYANSEKSGLIEEKVYDLDDGMDSEELIAKIIEMGPQKV